MNLRRSLLTVFSVVITALPLWAFAQGLVPCEDNCQFCHVAVLLNNIAAWLVGILSIVVALIFAVSGIQLVTSGGNVSAKETAKKRILNAFIGFVIVLAAWLIVDFIMKSLLSSDADLGTWNTIQCVSQPSATVQSRGLSNGAVITNECELVDPGTYDCSTLASQCEDGDGTPEYVTSPDGVESVTCRYSASAYAGSCEAITDPSNPCHASNPDMIDAFGDRVEEASVICNKESGGAPVKSGSDLCCGPSGNCSGAPSFSGGYFQINVLAHGDKVPGCDPGSFYSRNGTAGPQGDCVRRNSAGICTGWSCSITNTSMYNTCMEVTRNSELNFEIAKGLYEGRGNKFNDWSWSARRCDVPY